MNDALKQALPIFIFALTLRVVGSVVTTFTGLNPDSKADAVVFASSAEMIAMGWVNGQLYVPSPEVPEIYHLWGTFLAPFWLLPGPSGLYARLGNAVLGAFAIYNVYLVARYYHSHRAGVYSTLPMILYPSFVATHSTLLREAIVLFGITTAVRIALLPNGKRFRYATNAVAAGVLYVAFIQRTDNAVVFLSAFGAALVLYAAESGYLSKRALGAWIALSPFAVILTLPIIRDGLEFLARTREFRASGRALYLPDLVPRTIPEFAAFSWVGAAYFLYAPFPWMIETVPDFLLGLEGLVSIGFTIASIWGVRLMARKNAPGTVGLLVGLIVGAALYGVGTANYGTGMRHRQMFLWVIFLFGGIGIADHVRFEWPFRTISLSSDAERT
jgi:hypothetical protein